MNELYPPPQNRLILVLPPPKKSKNGIFLNERNQEYTKYELEFKNNKYASNNEKELKNIGLDLSDNMWKMTLE